MDLLDALVNIAGFVMIILVTYMIVRNVIRPRFFFPWMRKRERAELLEKGQRLLDSADLDDDERERVESAVSTLSMRGGGTGESWTRDDPYNAARADINAAWMTHGDEGAPDHDSLPTAGERQR